MLKSTDTITTKISVLTKGNRLKTMHKTPPTLPLVGIYYTEQAQKNKAEQLASTLDLPVTNTIAGYDLLLLVEDKLSLFIPNEPLQKGKVCAEFVTGAAGYRRKYSKKEMLLKAIGFRKGIPLKVLDVTGGLGKDSFLMASHGCIVHILEKNRIVAALLEDGLRRASEHPDTCKISARIRLSIQDSVQFLLTLSSTERLYDVVYLDPMYPERSKNALVKKEMQMLQKLIGHESDDLQLFRAALKTAGKRVVVKRPRTAPPIEGRKPTHTIIGKTTRYDVYMIPSWKNNL